MATNTALTYRLQGIPRAYNRHDTQDLACRLLSVDKSKVSIRSLALHPLKCDSKIATLSLLETPATIAPKPKTSVWSFREPDPIIAGKFLDFTLDIHFHGFTPLHDEEDDQCNTDLIALSGLNGHAFGSFKAKGLDFMWIRDALAKEFPGCRLFIYGYDTTMIQSTSRQSILDLGSQLASSVGGLVSASTTGSQSCRSLIFLGHSLGGLVVEQALVEMYSRVAIRLKYGPILPKITGVLLFGVPQKGMSVEALMTMVDEQPNSDLIASLSIDSDFLQLQQSNFQKARLEMSNASVVAFYETQETPTVQKNALGRWEMSGPSKLLVMKSSATSMSDTSIAVNRNHSEIVKFQQNDADYDRILSELRLMRRPNEQLHIEANSPTAEETKALQSLGFSEQHWRRDEISPREDTCEWLSENQTFQEWFRNPDDPELRRLWIRGHPGSGKSTLMKYAWKFLTRHLPASVMLASFFFHARGTSLQQNRIGFLRSILHQLAFHLPEARSCLMQHYAEKSTATQMLQWSEGELQQLIRESLTACTRQVCILVDALDEAGKQTAADLVKWFRVLTSNLPDVRVIFSCRYFPVLPTIIKSTISMENENATDIDRVVRAELRTEFNEDEAQVLENDIIQKANGMFQWATLVTNSVVETYREMGQSVQILRTMIHQLPPDLHALYDSLLSSIKAPERKQTIKLFTWILFAARPLKQSELQHALVVDAEMEARSVSEFSTSPLFVNVERAIKTFSRGLAEFKSHKKAKTAQFIHQSVVDYLEADGLGKLLELEGKTSVLGHAQLQLSRSCIRYLLLEELSEAAEALGDFYYLSVDDLHEEFPFAEYALHFWIIHTIHAESYGIDQKKLLDILPWARMDKVSRIFTVAWADTDYHQFGLSDKLPNPKVIGNLQKEFAWDNAWEFGDRKFDICCMYDFLWDMDENHDSLEVPFNLFALAGITSVWRKLIAEIEAERHAITDENLRETDSSLYKRSFYKTRSGELSSLLAILFGKPDIKLEEIPEPLIEAQVNDAYHITPLFLAVAMQREDLVRAFIRAGAQGNVICDDDNGPEGEEGVLSIFELAILIGNGSIICQLIDAYGPTPDEKSALHFAIRHGTDAVVHMLLDQYSSRYTAEEFIDFNENSQTPLQTAISCGEMTKCRKLVDTGADIENSADGSPLLLWYIDKEDDPEMLELLLEKGADPNRGPPEWRTPLMSAMSWTWTYAVELLLKYHHTDPNLADKRGLTGLMWMLLASHKHERRREEAVNITQLCALSGRFDMEIKDKMGETVLTKAATFMRPEIVDILLTDGKADANTRCARNLTPLMRAAFLGHWTITKLLLSCTNTDIEAQNSRGKTALYYAIVKGKITCANLILGHEKTDLQNLKIPLSLACFEAAEKGKGEFLAQLSDLQPLWFGHYLMSEIYNRAQQWNRRCIIRQLEEAGLRPQEDVVMTDAS